MRVTSDSGASPVTTLIDLRGRDAAGLTRPALDGVLPRAALDVERAVELVRPVCENVRARGGAAVREYTRRFDAVGLAQTRVPAETIARARPRAAAVPGGRGGAGGGGGARGRPPRAPGRAPAVAVPPGLAAVRGAGGSVPGGLPPPPSWVVMSGVPPRAAGVGPFGVASPP